MPFFDDSPKSFLEHLEDLRVLIIRLVGALAVGMTVCAIYAQDVLGVLTWPLVEAGQDPKDFLSVLQVTAAMDIHLQISFCGGIIFALPVMFYVLGNYLLPALESKERRWILPIFISGVVLFVFGVVFCYFMVIPQALKFFVEYNDWFGFKTNWTINYYLDFVINMLLAFGICFELPLVIMLLNFIGIVSSQSLSRCRKHAFMVILLFAAVITPTPDALSMLMLAAPMYFLYEICIWLTWWRDRKKLSDG